MRHDTLATRTLTSAADATPWANVKDYHPKAVQVWGTFTATWKLQGKLTADASYEDLVTGKTAGDIIVISVPVVAVKLVCTAYTSGTISAVFSGFDRRTE
jgi:hypothetical protein